MRERGRPSSLMPQGGGEWLTFGLTFATVALLYSLFLPAGATQAVSFANWHYLTALSASSSVLFALLMAFIVTLEKRSLGNLRPRTSRRLGLIAAVGALLPNLFCCTPVVPALMGLAGVSTAGAFAAGGRIQGFFAVHEDLFLLASLVLLAVCATLAVRSCRTSACALPPDRG